MLKSFSGDYAFLSNFYHSPFEIDGIKYPDVETAFQASKTINHMERVTVLQCKTPGAAKKMGKKVTMRPDWEEVKVVYMYKYVREKFKQNPELAEKLIDTGSLELVEGNYWHDQFWGDCNCDKHYNIPGKNALGQILMQVREELKTDRCI